MMAAFERLSMGTFYKDSHKRNQTFGTSKQTLSRPLQTSQLAHRIFCHHLQPRPSKGTASSPRLLFGLVWPSGLIEMIRNLVTNEKAPCEASITVAELTEDEGAPSEEPVEFVWKKRRLFSRTRIADDASRTFGDWPIRVDGSFSLAAETGWPKSVVMVVIEPRLWPKRTNLSCGFRHLA